MLNNFVKFKIQIQRISHHCYNIFISIGYKLQTEYYVLHVHVCHCASLQADGVAGLQTLVESSAPGGAHPAATAVMGVPGLVLCLPHHA